MDGIQFQQVLFQAKFQIVPLRNVCRAFNSSSFQKGHYVGTLQSAIDEFSNKNDQRHLSTASALEQNKSEKISADSHEEYESHIIYAGLYEDAECSAKVCAHISDKEIDRRKKIGLANKGRTPWNKGRKHSEETRKRIKQRTIEALSDPKVRKKMSESPRSHSDRSRERISFGLKKIWEKRLKRRRLQENCYLMWTKSIAEAARIGDCDQEELEWHSYEKMKSDLLAEHLQWKAEKERAKEVAKIKAEMYVKVRAENAARLAQKRLEKQEREKARVMKALARKKSENKKLKMALSKGLKLKARLTKFHNHKKESGSSVISPRGMATDTCTVTEELDIELIKIEKMRKEVSLAEQIRDSKNRKADLPSKEVHRIASSTPIKQKAGESYVILHSTRSSKHGIMDQLG